MPQTTAPRSIQYGDLSTRCAEYERMAHVREAIDDFYRGGYVLAEKAGKYIPKLLGENPRRYAERIKSGSYFNYFAQITDYYASALFTQELAVRPAGDADDPSTPGDEPDDDDLYTKFSKNADGNGRSLNEVLGALVITALKQRCAWLHVEMPEAIPVATKAEEEALGLGMPYLFEVPHEQVIDWDIDDDGEFIYVVIHDRKHLRGTPGARRKTIRETFKIWRREVEDSGDASVAWALYAIHYEPEKPPRPTDEVPIEDEGVTSFPRIPLLNMELPDGLWIGNKLCPMAREHFQRRTSLNAAENRSMVAIPVAKLGPDTPSSTHPISEAQQDTNRGVDPVSAFYAKGYEVIGAGDSLEFVEPLGKAYEHIAKRIDDLKNEMFRISHQLAASASMQASAVKRSGKSKEEDRAAEALVLGALGRVVRNFGVILFDTISQSRGEDIVWVPHGLDTYEHEDREQTLEESIQLQAVDIPSATFRKEHAKRVYRKLVPNLPPATTAQIDKEIDEGVDDQQTIRDLEHDVQKETLENPPPPAGPAPGAPPKPKPAAAPAKKAA